MRKTRKREWPNLDGYLSVSWVNRYLDLGNVAIAQYTVVISNGTVAILDVAYLVCELMIAQQRYFLVHYKMTPTALIFVLNESPS